MKKNKMIVVSAMKRRYYYLIVVIVGVITLILLINTRTNLYSIDVDIKFVDKFTDEEEQKLKVCVLNKYQDYDFVEVSIKNDIDSYLYIFELYNIRRNALPVGFEVGSNYILEVMSYEKIDDCIVFTIKESNIPDDDLTKLIQMLLITYHLMDINTVKLIMGNETYQLEYKS